MFLKVSFNKIISLIKIKNLLLTELVKCIEIQLNISKINFYSSDNLLIAHEDVIEYINQFINTDSKFILYLNDSTTETLIEKNNSCTSDLNCIELRDSSIIDIQDIEFVPSAFNFSIFNNFENKEDLQKYIENNHQIIFKIFFKTKKLQNQDRIILSKSIIHHLLKDPNRILLPSELENISILLCEIFIGELPNTYYQKYCQGRHASGKLHDAYNNYRNRLAKAGIITRRSKSKSKTPSETFKELDINNPEIEEILIQLSTEIDINLITPKWKICFHNRSQLLFTDISTSNYIKRFPGLEQQEGFKLLHIDVFMKYEKQLKAFYPENFLTILLEKTKNSKSESIPLVIKLINTETDESKKLSLSLMLLPYAIPTAIRRTKKGTQKASKAEVADTFILHYMDCAKADSGLRQLIKKSEERKQEVQPVIVFIGSPVELCWVIVAHVKYIFDNPVEAIKSCIAAYLGLNINYPKISEKIWLFLQKYIFDISTPYDAVDATIKTLANDLNFPQQNGSN